MTAPVMLVVLDGFGLGDGGPDDATAKAHGPFFARMRETCPVAEVETSGEAVGLPPGQMGNSEVGHMTMGAGRIIEQDLTAISRALSGDEIENNAALQAMFGTLEQSGKTLHLMGLLSDGGVHSHQDHLYALLEASTARGIDTVVHAFLDGRDCPPSSGLGFMRELLPHLARTGATVATVSGRYYAMDRDARWDRIAKAYAAACTPDFYVFDEEGKLTYAGQFDDTRPGDDGESPGTDLRRAVEATLTGQVVERPWYPSAGCNIKWKAGNEPDYF